MRRGLRTGAALAGALATLAGGAVSAAGQEDEPALTITADAVEIDLSGRVQTQMATSGCSDVPFDADSPCVEQVPAVDLFLRRVRLSASVEISDLVDAEIQPDFAEVDGVELKDAWGRLSFGPGLRVQVGHFKRPFDGFQLTSSTRILTIERDLDVPGVPGLAAPSLDELTTAFRVSDRDVGAMANGSPAGTGLEYWVGLFNGRGPDADGDLNSGKQVVGRLEYTVRPAGSLPLSVAAAAASTDLPVRGAADPPGTRGSGLRYANYELWAELGDFQPGPHVQAGLVFGDTPLQTDAGEPLDPDVPAAGRDLGSAMAWQVIGAWRLALGDGGRLAAVEPVLRVTRADPHTGVAADEAWGVTPGVQLFFGGRNKLAINWDRVLYADDATDAVSSFKAQLQVHF